ncbi:MAG: extracellular elastinolytic metalloproteinase, partial [Saprospiraceae bacterium]
MSLSILKKIFLFCLVFLLTGQFSFAQTQDALTIAQKHLDENKQELKLTAADLTNYEVSDNYVSQHNGVTHLYLIQRHNEIEVYNGMININILPT